MLTDLRGRPGAGAEAGTEAVLGMVTLVIVREEPAHYLYCLTTVHRGNRGTTHAPTSAFTIKTLVDTRH